MIAATFKQSFYSPSKQGVAPMAAIWFMAFCGARAVIPVPDPGFYQSDALICGTGWVPLGSSQPWETVQSARLRSPNVGTLDTSWLCLPQITNENGRPMATGSHNHQALETVGTGKAGRTTAAPLLRKCHSVNMLAKKQTAVGDLFACVLCCGNQRHGDVIQFCLGQSGW